MAQEDKQLLIKDLSTRLPYGVMVLEDINKEFDGGCVSKLTTITEIKGEKMFLSKNSLTPVTIEEIRPYLRPISSITKKEDKEWQIYKNNIACACDENLNERINELYDWFYKHHFDFCGLIEKGLALKAPEGMYNIEEE